MAIRIQPLVYAEYRGIEIKNRDGKETTYGNFLTKVQDAEETFRVKGLPLSVAQGLVRGELYLIEVIVSEFEFNGRQGVSVKWVGLGPSLKAK